jgi:hypothetical protein
MLAHQDEKRKATQDHRSTWKPAGTSQPLGFH